MRQAAEVFADCAALLPRGEPRRVKTKRPPRTALTAPFPWFGGKSRVAAVVWPRFGDVVNYVEPFAGSLAVLLGRPRDWSPPLVYKNETVNDLDCMLANFWRAVQAAPDEVAHHADWPVNEADLHARHRWLHAQFPRLREGLHTDPDFYDAKVAGWWVWGISAWIGDGWCRETLQGRPHLKGSHGIHAHGRDENRFQTCNKPRGVHAKGKRPALKSGVGANSCRVRYREKPYENGTLWKARPHIAPQGVNAIRPCDEKKRPQLGKGGRGVCGKLPRLTESGASMHRPGLKTVSDKTRPSVQGSDVHRKMLDAKGRKGVDRVEFREPSRQLPDISGQDGASGKGVASKRIPAGLHEYMARLAERLRHVRVCCGDWKRILGPSPTVHIGTTAVFLDPPYGDKKRDKVYNQDGLAIAAEVRKWCFERGHDPKLRIALCGYEGEHEELEALGWDVVQWKAGGGYARSKQAKRNAWRERIWFSPGCLPPARGEQTELFENGVD